MRTSSGQVIWLTGLSGAGKSTLARALEHVFAGESRAVCRLDGDELRRGLSADLGFSLHDRREHIRRVGEVAALVADAGILVIVALISPLRASRDAVRRRVGGDRFVEVFVNAPLSVCEARDVSGLYARSRRGELADFTGVSSPYESPLTPDIEIRTDELSVDDSVRAILDYLAARTPA